MLFFAAVDSGLAQQPAPQPEQHAGCTDRPKDYLHGRLATWQERLQLQDWKISIVFSNPGEMRPNSLGSIRWDADTKGAVIRVLDPAHYRKACPEMLADMEFTIVHELIHLELSSLPRSQASRSVEERAVNRIAEALLKLDRQK